MIQHLLGTALEFAKEFVSQEFCKQHYRHQRYSGDSSLHTSMVADVEFLSQSGAIE